MAPSGDEAPIRVLPVISTKSIRCKSDALHDSQALNQLVPTPVIGPAELLEADKALFAAAVEVHPVDCARRRKIDGSVRRFVV